jgi:hypothetical protein
VVAWFDCGLFYDRLEEWPLTAMSSPNETDDLSQKWNSLRIMVSYKVYQARKKTLYGWEKPMEFVSVIAQ